MPTRVDWASATTLVIALAGVVLLGVMMRSWEWTARGLWFDEAFTWRLVRFGFPEMLERAAQDNSPPLYYVLLYAWTRALGDSLAALRGLSVLLGLLTVGGMYLFVREAFEGRRGRPPGLALFVAALTATSAFQVRYTCEVRPYALGAALAALSAWTLSRATRMGPPSARAWAAHGAASLALAYTHYYALFTLAAQAAYVAGWLLAGWRSDAEARRPAAGYALLAGGAVAIGWLPWLPTFLAQVSQVQTDFWAPHGGWVIPDICYQMLIDPEPQPADGPPHARSLLAAAACAALVVAVGWKARGSDWQVLLAAAGPFGLAALASEFGTQTLCLRYFLFAHLFLLAGVGVLVWRVRNGAARVAAAGVLLAANSALAVDFLRGLHLADNPGARGASEFVASSRRTDELVVVSTPLWYFPMAYHLRDGGVRVYDPGVPIPHYHGTAALQPGDAIAAAGLGRGGGLRLWVINGQGGCWGRREVPVPAGWVRRAEYRFPESLRVGTAVVVLYERPGPPGEPGQE